ncbi:hypothetical protein Dimus_023086 [Dionaea muscipula]
MEVIKRQKWEKLFKRRDLVHVDVVKEFYAKLTMSHNRKKDVARSKVRGVEIEFDHMKLESILGIPGNNGICEYIKEAWEELRYTKPLEITRKFANDETIMEARRVKSVEMRPFQRFIHFLVMKNMVPRFGKRDTISYMDLIYMDHLIARRSVNPPRDHELPYGDRLTMVFEEFDVPFVDKKEKNQRGTITMRRPSSPCIVDKGEWSLVDWWIGTREYRRRDDEIEAPAEEEVVIDEAADHGESWSERIFMMSKMRFKNLQTMVEEVPKNGRTSFNSRKETEATRVDPSVYLGHILKLVMNKSQAEFERARADRIQADLEKAQAENTRLLALFQQAKNPPQP